MVNPLMAKLTLASLTSSYRSNAALNANFDAIEAAIENTLSRDGTSPNAMAANLDMGSNLIVNLADPTAAQEGATKNYVDGVISTGAANAAAAAASAAAAAVSETNAASSEANAATSASNAATSEANAATSEANAEAAYDAFDDRYLGSKASAPTLDNDGNALLDGALYWDTTDNALYVYDLGNTTWVRTTDGIVSVTTNEFTGDGATLAFTISGSPPSDGHLVVTVDGVSQPISSYSVSGTTLTFTEAPPTDSLVEARGFEFASYSSIDLSSYVTKTGTDTLTNKTLTSPVLNGTLSGTGISQYTYVVDTIAELKALTGGVNEVVEVKGHTSSGDGGGGIFYWDGSDTTTDDNGWYIQPNAGGTGRWIRADRSVVNVKHFGAQGDGVEDAGETTALTAAYNKWTSLMGSQGAQYPSASQVALVIPPGDYFPDSVLTWSPQGTGAQIICWGLLREVQINPQGTRQTFTGLNLAGTADETSAATYGILLDDAVSDEIRIQDFTIRDRPTGLRINAVNAGNNFFVNGLIRDCTTYGIHADAGASNNFTNVASDGNAKNLYLDGVSGGGEFKFVNCRFGNTLAAGDDISAHIIGTAAASAVESYFTQCTFTASRNDGRQLSITGVTDAGGGKIEITTSTDHKLFDTWDDTFSISGTTSYNGTFDASDDGLEVTGTNTFRMTATYVASETGTLNLPPWDLYIESDTVSDISDVNDMFFQGGNINHCFVKSALKVQFIGTRLKQSIFLEDDDAANKKGVHRVFIVGDARGRAQSTYADVPVAGATAGWVRIGTKDDTGGVSPANTKFVIETPDTSAALGSDNLPVTQKMELTGSAFRFLTGATVNFQVDDDGDITSLPFIGNAAAGTDNKIEVVSNASGSNPIVRPYSDVDTNVDLRFDSKGTGDIDIRPGGQRALLCNYISGAVNYFTVSPASGSTINMTAAGTATNVSVDYRSKGTGNVNLRSGGGTRQVQINNTGCGFFGTAPTAQPSTTGTTTGFTAGSGTAANDDSTFTGNTGSTAYTVGDIVKALKDLGLLAS